MKYQNIHILPIGHVNILFKYFNKSSCNILIIKLNANISILDNLDYFFQFDTISLLKYTSLLYFLLSLH